MRKCGDVRRHKYLGVTPKRIVRGWRLGHQHIKGSRRQSACVKRLQQIYCNDMAAPSNVYESRAIWQRLQQITVDDALRLRVQRQ